jgi:hypothetical protein
MPTLIGFQNQIFGLRHTLNNLDAHDTAVARARLSGRLIYLLYAPLSEKESKWYLKRS